MKFLLNQQSTLNNTSQKYSRVALTIKGSIQPRDVWTRTTIMPFCNSSPASPANTSTFNLRDLLRARPFPYIRLGSSENKERGSSGRY